MESMINQKIGILGGTFNPIHLGHLIIAQNALEAYRLDKVLIMPSGVSYLKDPNTIVDTNHRINMVRLSIDDNPFFELSTIETDRSGNSYTFETLCELKSQFPNNEYYYICGADTLFNIEYWKKPDLIFKNSTLVCALRNGINITELQNKANELTSRFGGKVVFLTAPEVEISSTSLRQMIKEGYSCKYYLNDKVIDYIKDNNLYVNI